ncbi:lipocalin family protein [Oleiharenicola lentus]|uniref:lipocalin family protein n=1 Tax=Oleiharenicola lentus TaxID=2508720 RepID=UPI003F67D22B
MKSLTILFLVCATLFTGCQSRTSGNSDKQAAENLPPLKTVAHVDLPRYMGDWYVIANIPYFAEEGKVASIERYELRPDGKIENTFIFKKDSFDAKEKEWNAVAEITNTTTNAEWNIQFFWPFKVEYRIIDLAPDYSWAAIGHPSRKYFWVIARARTLDEKTYQGILARAAAQGFNISEVTKVPQPTN